MDRCRKSALLKGKERQTANENKMYLHFYILNISTNDFQGWFHSLKLTFWLQVIMMWESLNMGRGNEYSLQGEQSPSIPIKARAPFDQ